jgi:tetratricopeptide (TPR) repeat protein
VSTLSPATPSFVLGYWRPWNENANAFTSYLDYARDVSLAKYGADTVGTYVAQASQDHVQSVKDLSRSLGFEFGVVSRKLSAIESSLGFLNRNMEMAVEQQRLSNMLLQNIAELLRVPDSEKERQHSIEAGIKFFINASRDPDLYSDALEMLLKAEALMKQDYFVLHRIGCIYLHAEKFVDPAKALDYFCRAAKYASVESDPKAARLANVLAANRGATSSTIPESSDAVRVLAADSYEKAAFAAYILGRSDEAKTLQLKAIDLAPTAHKQFTLAKYQVRCGDVTEAVNSLEQALACIPLLIPAVLRDIDLLNEPAILKLVSRNEGSIGLCRLIFDTTTDSGIVTRFIRYGINACELKIKRSSGLLGDLTHAKTKCRSCGSVYPPTYTLAEHAERECCVGPMQFYCDKCKSFLAGRTLLYGACAPCEAKAQAQWKAGHNAFAYQKEKAGTLVSALSELVDSSAQDKQAQFLGLLDKLHQLIGPADVTFLNLHRHAKRYDALLEAWTVAAATDNDAQARASELIAFVLQVDQEMSGSIKAPKESDNIVPSDHKSVGPDEKSNNRARREGALGDDSASGLLLIDALTLVSAADGRVSSGELGAIAAAISQQKCGLSGDRITARVKQAIARIQAGGVSAFAKEVRNRLAPYRGTQFLADILQAMTDISERDGTVHDNERRVIEWFKDQVAK